MVLQVHNGFTPGVPVHRGLDGVDGGAGVGGDVPGLRHGAGRAGVCWVQAEVDRNTRLGHLVAQTFDAAATMVGGATHEMSLGMVVSLCYVVLSGANVALSSFVSAAMWIPTTLPPPSRSPPPPPSVDTEAEAAASGQFEFDGVIRAVYQSSGKLGIAVDNLCVIVAGEPDLADLRTLLKHACALLSSHRVDLRAAAAMRAGAHVDASPSSAPPRLNGGGVATMAHHRKKQRRRDANVHWVDMAAEEPSSDEGGGEGDFDDDEDDAIFCVRPSRGATKGGSGSIAGWDMVGWDKNHNPPEHQRLARR